MTTQNVRALTDKARRSACRSFRGRRPDPRGESPTHGESPRLQTRGSEEGWLHVPSGGLHLYPRWDRGPWSHMVSGLETSLTRGLSLAEVFLAGWGSWGRGLGQGAYVTPAAGRLDPKPRLLV